MKSEFLGCKIFNIYVRLLYNDEQIKIEQFSDVLKITTTTTTIKNK